MIPPTFCWTKMGVESGEGLDAIIRRKEWERILGEGLFFWGIGQSLGDNARNAAQSIPEEMKVLFSPMLSKAKAIDVTPGDVFIWNSWVDEKGVNRPLPKNVLLTSRADLPSGRRKSSHYALVCKSSHALSNKTDLEVTSGRLRNYSSDKRLGASQVTAVVRHVDGVADCDAAKKYSVSFVATMEAPYSVQLADPEVLRPSDVREIEEISLHGTISDWHRLVRRLRGRRKPEAKSAITLELFGDPSAASAIVG